ncbi:MAG: DUF4981 domain-containing protein, partial [Bacteroidales bacterium]|nr:DUF4981 domain-containing protein [Bacteroidales bacterium]
AYDDSGWDMIPVPSNWNVVGLGKDGSQKYGTPIYVNVNVPWLYRIEPDDWKEGVMRTPPEDWTVYNTRNEVGSYRRTFTIPDGWNGKRIYVAFDGVDSFFYLWINGKYVGFSKNSRNLAEFDITEYLNEDGSENLIAVEVYRFSDGANFEAQDMFRLPGIFRSVSLVAKNPAHIRDIRITPSMSSLHVELDAVDAPSGASLSYELFENGLYSDENSPVASFEGCGMSAELGFPGAKPWSAEAPHRYTLVGKLLDKDGKVLDIFSTYCGFREVEIRDTKASEDEFGLAGRYFYLNGKPVKLRGVNRHETHPTTGHAVTREMMEEDLFLMKRANINHVRCSHYPDDPYWYYLCDKYGIYLMDEANLESHHYHYGDASLSHVPEMLDAHLARMMEMVVSDYNHPSVIIWSMGNEAGPGVNFKKTYDLAKSYDPMRPVQYERNNDYSDIGCRQYPSVDWVREVAGGKSDVKYPYHLNEFAHSMGNALGDFADYWELMDSTNYMMGGCIWDWVDQGLYNWTPEGVRYIGYGGDFGDVPNDGQFVMNGVILADRTPKPQYWEVKKVYQPVDMKLSADGRSVEFFNRNYYEAASFDGLWEVVCETGVLSSGEFRTGEIAPRSSVTLEIPYDTSGYDGEKFLNLSLAAPEALPWASEKGFEVCKEQFFIGGSRAAAQKGYNTPLVVRVDRQNYTIVKGRGFKAVFADFYGTLCKLKYRGRNVILPYGGPELDVYRSFVNNDRWIYKEWLEGGIVYLARNSELRRIKQISDEEVTIEYDVEARGIPAVMEGNTDTNYNSISKGDSSDGTIEFTLKVIWTVHNDGRVDMDTEIVSDKPDQVLGRIGFTMKMPAAYKNLKYFGRGPVENYPDRYTSSFVGLYESRVDKEYFEYAKPQETGSHEGVRWAEITRRNGSGIRFEASMNSLRPDGTMSFQALPWSALEMSRALHTHELPEPSASWVSLDAAVLGLGGNSCGPIPMEKDILRAGPVRFEFSISPVKR